MYDASSPILDFYPEDFEEDMNGKKQSWEATVKIPFIDHDRLLKAMAGMSHIECLRGCMLTELPVSSQLGTIV